MVRVRKSILIILVIAAVLCGAVGTYLVTRTKVIDIPALQGNELSDEELAEYEYLKKTYGKMDFLKDYIVKNYYKDVDVDALMTSAYKGLFEGLGDPYSGFLTEAEFDQLMQDSAGEYSGIGVTITPGDNGYILILAVSVGSPADQAGIRVGDCILAVDGEPYTGEQYDLAATHMRGVAGTDVVVTIYRDGQQFDVTLTRATIITETVFREMLDDTTGYIQVTSFDENTAEHFRSALREISSSGAKSFVLDLRDNGGGLVDICLEIADELIDNATVVYVEDNAGHREYYNADKGRTRMKYVVLVNGYSASASEILTAGIQDNGEAPIIGTETFGKGIIQTCDQLTDGTGIKLTILQYYSPSGNTIHGVGITPDYIVELTDDCFDEEGNLVNDIQLEKAKEVLKNMK
jgi:carboxyl-terminal processing protease